MGFLRRHWRNQDELIDIRQDVYEKVLAAVSVSELPQNAKAYVFTAARNQMINMSRRAAVVSFDLVADLEDVHRDLDLQATDRQLSARDELRKTQEVMDELPARCREVIRLRKIEGFSTLEVAEQLRVSVSSIEKDLTFGMRAITDRLLGETTPARLPLRRSRQRKGLMS